MVMNRFWIAGMVALFAPGLSFATLEVFSGRTGQPIPEAEFYSQLETAQEWILGETHSTAEVQRAESEIIDRISALKPKYRPTVFWEFLSVSDSARIQTIFDSFVQDSISSEMAIDQIFGAARSERLYAPVLEIIKKRGGSLVATNLSRTEKAPVVRGGIAALNPALLPPGFTLGSEGYRRRFLEAMGGHGDPAVLANYFAAQCLVDEVIAHQMEIHSSQDLRFLIVGNFHSNYFDGVYASLARRVPGLKRISIRLESASLVSPTERAEIISGTPADGPTADFIVFAQ